jgi:hypothetical protein
MTTKFGKIYCLENNKIEDYYGTNLSIPRYHVAIAIDKSGLIYSYDKVPKINKSNDGWTGSKIEYLEIGYIEKSVENWKESLMVYEK